MFLGGTMVTLGYLFGFYAAVRAFGGTTLARGGRRRLPRGLRGRASGTDARRNRRGRSGADRRARERRPRQGDRGARGAAVPVGDVLDPDPSRLAVVHGVVARRRDLSGRWHDRTSPVHLQRHLIMLAGAAAAFFLAFLIVDNNTVSVSDWETQRSPSGSTTRPAWLAHGLWPIMQLGTVWGPIVIGIVVDLRLRMAPGRRGRSSVVSPRGSSPSTSRTSCRAAVRCTSSRRSTCAKGKATGLGFVSGHTAVAFADRDGACCRCSRCGAGSSPTRSRRSSAWRASCTACTSRSTWSAARPWASCAAASSTS